jgi:hypothetical protein
MLKERSHPAGENDLPDLRRSNHVKVQKFTKTLLFLYQFRVFLNPARSQTLSPKLHKRAQLGTFWHFLAPFGTLFRGGAWKTWGKAEIWKVENRNIPTKDH